VMMWMYCPCTHNIQYSIKHSIKSVNGNYETDDWDFIIMDAKNSFNELNRETILDDCIQLLLYNH